MNYKKLHHQMSQPSALQHDSCHSQHLPKASRRLPTSLLPLREVLLQKKPYDPICLNDFTPSDRRQRYEYTHSHSLKIHSDCFCLHRYINELEKGVSVGTVLYTHSTGGSILSQHFVWRIPDDFSVEAGLTENQKVIQKLKQDLPVYHTRAMQKEFISSYGRLTNGAKPYVLRSIIKKIIPTTYRRCKWS